MEEAENLHAQAWALALEAKDFDQLIRVDYWLASDYFNQGDFRTAEQLFATALNNCSGLSALFRLHPMTKAIVEREIIKINLLKGRPGAIQSYFNFLSTLKRKRIQIYLSGTNCDAGYLELHNGHLDVAQHFFETVQESYDGDDFWSWRRFIVLADLADQQGDYARSNALRTQLLELMGVTPDPLIKGFLAAYLAKEGDVERARELLVPLFKHTTRHKSLDILFLYYFAGMVELTDGKFAKAEDYFHETIEISISLSCLVFRARSYTALGETAVAKGDLSSAKKHFETTTELCKIMDLPRERLYFGFACYVPHKRFNGWNLYHEGHVMFSHVGDNAQA